jgi:hypothetical protein
MVCRGLLISVSEAGVRTGAGARAADEVSGARAFISGRRGGAINRLVAPGTAVDDTVGASSRRAAIFKSVANFAGAVHHITASCIASHALKERKYGSLQLYSVIS